MNDPTQVSIYQLRAVLNGVSPLVWRRFLLSIETIWPISTRSYSCPSVGVTSICTSSVFMGKHLARMQKIPAQSAWVTFSCAQLNASAIGTTSWHLGIRSAAGTTVPLHEDLTYPRCVGGRHPAPDEDDGGAWDYQRLQDHYKLPPLEALSVLARNGLPVAMERKLALRK